MISLGWLKITYGLRISSKRNNKNDVILTTAATAAAKAVVIKFPCYVEKITPLLEYQQVVPDPMLLEVQIYFTKNVLFVLKKNTHYRYLEI